jgi:hypothetical protein
MNVVGPLFAGWLLVVGLFRLNLAGYSDAAFFRRHALLVTEVWVLRKNARPIRDQKG